MDDNRDTAKLIRQLDYINSSISDTHEQGKILRATAKSLHGALIPLTSDADEMSELLVDIDDIKAGTITLLCSSALSVTKQVNTIREELQHGEQPDQDILDLLMIMLHDILHTIGDFDMIDTLYNEAQVWSSCSSDAYDYARTGIDPGCAIDMTRATTFNQRYELADAMAAIADCHKRAAEYLTDLADDCDKLVKLLLPLTLTL